MNATETKLQRLLEGTQQYVIPLFQRVYSWDKKNWDELWRDLLDVYEAENTQEHFMGAIVTMPIDMLPHGVSKYLLIDGQQRLTTIFVILAAIRDLTVGKSELADQINELYLINKWGKGDNRLKLLPTDADKEAFIDIIDRRHNPESHFKDLYTFFKKKLSGNDNEDKPIDLSKFQNDIMQQLTFVSVVLNANDSPYRIFYSLNGTGQPLTQADLVRNHFFMHIPSTEDQKTAYHDVWLPMQSSLGEKLTEFMWYYIIKDGTYVRQSGIYDVLRASTEGTSPNEIVNKLLDMYTYHEHYLKLITPEKEENPQIRKRLKRINKWEINTAYPFLLNIYGQYMENKLSQDDMCDILDLIESFVVRRFFCRIHTNALNKYFTAMYRAIEPSNGQLVGAAYDFLLSRQFPSDEQFLSAWERFPIYASGTSKTRHILESLEEMIYTNNEPVNMDHSRITIEHIMPQNLNEQWKSTLGEDATSVHATYLHTIGNLTLSGLNEAMGDISFEDKRQFFAKSNFALNKQICEYNHWNKEEIIERSRKLGEIALQIWRRP